MTRIVVQRHRVNRVINFVHANSHNNIDLHCLADVAYLSKFHFVRVFEAYLGQTPLRYLNRVRLERAARQLIFLPNKAVGNIAADCGFTSHHSFTRAFSRDFGYAPQDFKTLYTKLDQIMPITISNEVCKHMTIRVENRPATRIAYIRNFGPYRRDCGEIGEASELIRDWAETRGQDNRKPLIGLCPDNRRITPSPYCVYDIGIPVANEVGEDDIVSILTIPAGRYAIAGVRCRNEQLLAVWTWLCSTWLESHAESYDQRWSYEVFRDSLDGNLKPERGMDICLRLSD